MILETLVVGPLAVNCYLFGSHESGEAFVVDPGDEAEKILSLIDKTKVTLRYILLTHAHFDHLGAVAALRAATGARVMIHKEEKMIVENLSLQTVLFGFPKPAHFEVDHWLRNDEIIPFGDMPVKTLFTPGHSLGGVCYHIDDILFSGDTLFCESVGRTDLPGGSPQRLMRSIHEQIWALVDETQVFPGHGPATTIAHEKRSNPFVR